MNKTVILLIDCGSDFIKHLRNSIFDYANINIVKIDELEFYKKNTFDGVVISGAPILLTEVDQDFYLKKISKFFYFDKPILGICFGHQLMGLNFGSEIILGENRNTQDLIRIKNKSLLFKDFNVDKFQQQERHKEDITLPENFVLLASSKRTKVEAMKHKDKPFFGVQFHPEISGELGEQILKNFVDIVKAHD